MKDKGRFSGRKGLGQSFVPTSQEILERYPVGKNERARSMILIWNERKGRNNDPRKAQCGYGTKRGWDITKRICDLGE